MKHALAALTLAWAACGPTGMSGPTMNGRVEDPGEPGTPRPSAIQSNDILARDAVTSRAKVLHILIGWKDLGEVYGGRLDARAAGRTREQADELAAQLLARVRGGENVEQLMMRYSEDPGSASTRTSYDVTAGAKLVFEFKRLALRLKLGEAGLVMTQFGWHVMVRVG